MQVYNRLQNFGICFSDVTTRKIIDNMGVDHDRHVRDWVKKLKATISPNQVKFWLSTFILLSN